MGQGVKLFTRTAGTIFWKTPGRDKIFELAKSW